MLKYVIILFFGLTLKALSQNFDAQYTPSSLPSGKSPIYKGNNEEPFFYVSLSMKLYKKKQKTGKLLVGIGGLFLCAGAAIGIVGIAEQGINNISISYIIGACTVGVPGIVLAGIGGNMAIFNGIKYKIAKSKHLSVLPLPTGLKVAYTF